MDKKRQCYKSFCSKLQSLTRRNLTRLKLPVSEIEDAVKREGKNCKKTFCDDATCSHAHPFIQEKVVDGFSPGTDVKMLKSLGATSNCGIITRPVIIGDKPNRGWSVLLDRSVVAEGKK